MVSARVLRDELAAQLPAMLGEITELAAIDSGSYDAAGVNRVQDGYGALLEAAGCTITRAPLPGRGDQLTARLEIGDGPLVLVVGHADTVWPAGTTDGWPVVHDGGSLSGPGVGDMKACVVMAAHALGVAAAHGLQGLGAVELLLVPDEELGSPGSREWIERRARNAAACLGLEAGWPGGGVVIARGAVGAVHVSARGRAAHCAAHEDEGASAVAALAALVAPLEACSRPADGVRVSVGIFRGGTARQVVPDEAELHLDLRAPGADAADALLSRVRAVVDAGGREGVELSVRGGFTRPAFEPAVSRDLLAAASARADEIAIALVPERTRGGADTSFAGALGVPTLDGLGPICHDSCARGERIEVASLAERGAVFAGLLLDLAARTPILPTAVGYMPYSG